MIRRLLFFLIIVGDGTDATRINRNAEILTIRLQSYIVDSKVIAYRFGRFQPESEYSSSVHFTDRLKPIVYLKSEKKVRRKSEKK